MMIMYVLARCEEQDHGARLDWEVLVEGGIFEFLHRVVLTDIKPPIYHELMREKGLFSISGSTGNWSSAFLP